MMVFLEVQKNRPQFRVQRNVLLLVLVFGSEGSSHWDLQELNVGWGYVAAVAIKSSCPIDFRTDFFIENDVSSPANSAVRW
jgi:hypothetical protein